MGKGKEPRVLRLANAYLEWCEGRRERLEHWPALNDQIQRAAASLVANLGEGFDSGTMGDKRRYFRYALASVGESRKLVIGAAKVGALSSPHTQDPLVLLRDIKWDLIRLIRWTHR